MNPSCLINQNDNRYTWFYSTSSLKTLKEKQRDKYKIKSIDKSYFLQNVSWRLAIRVQRALSLELRISAGIIVYKGIKREKKKKKKPVHAKWLHLCPILCTPVDCSPPGSSVHGILQARILEWVVMPSSRGSSRTTDWTPVSYVYCIGRWVLTPNTTWEATVYISTIFLAAKLSNFSQDAWTFSFNEKWSDMAYSCKQLIIFIKNCFVK